MMDNIRAFRGKNPSAAFNMWLEQLDPEVIHRAIMSKHESTGIWRELWDHAAEGK